MTREEAAKNPVDLAIWEFENAIKGTEEDNSEYPNYCIHIDEYKTALKALLWMKGPQPDPDTGPEGCWHCRNIEAHRIEYVIAVRTKGGTPMNTPGDCPYHYCPACGRKLEGRQ